MERLNFTPELKSFDEDQGTALFYFSKFGNLDYGLDIVEPTFFDEVIATTPAKRVPFMADHSQSVRDRLGVVRTLSKDAVGALADVKFSLHRELARDVYQDFIHDPESMEFSFAFAIEPDGFFFDEKGYRHLTKASDLGDIANVVRGMNPATELVAVKGDVPELAHPHNTLDARIRLAQAKLNLR